jgi:hypothetical protein
MKKAIRKSLVLVLLVGAVSFACLVNMSAQVQTQTTTTTHQASVETKVDRAEVVHVSGNDLVVKMEDGTIRHIPNVPESARVTVDGQQLGIHDLKVGMKLQRTITTTTTPKTITTVQSVSGKVWHVNPPSSVILTLQDGKNQQFKIPKDQKFNVDGQMVDAWGLKKGMNISAKKATVDRLDATTASGSARGRAHPDCIGRANAGGSCCRSREVAKDGQRTAIGWLARTVLVAERTQPACVSQVALVSPAEGLVQRSRQARWSRTMP